MGNVMVGTNRQKIIRSYLILVDKTDDMETLKEIGKQILVDHRITLKEAALPFDSVMDKLERMT